LREQIDQLTEIEISSAIANRRETRSQHPVGLIRAAVLIPFFRVESGWHILFTKRTDHLETHKGQVAFPGGAVDHSDLSPEETALRETFEEVGIFPHTVRILGRMDDVPTITNFLVTPIVGAIDWPVPLRLAEAEVSRVFSVPLVWLADPRNRETRLYERKNGTRENVVFFSPYDGETIWGVTGRLMENLLDILIKRTA
jgi:8-oxo-dGTP pyrophosphatase MutT (NUDIX family)